MSKLQQLDDSDEILLELKDGIGRITLNRPDQRNPITTELPGLLQRAFDQFEADPACRVIILTGSGSAFCGGADVKGLVDPAKNDPESQYLFVRDAFRMNQRIRSLDLPVIAAVNGVAVGGGAVLGLAADIAIASTKASYYFAFGRIGASGADMGCTHLLPRHVGTMKAAHLILTGAHIDAAEGKQLGLFIDVVSPEELLATAEAMAQQIIDAYPRRAAAFTKMALVRGENADFNTTTEYEAIAQNYTLRLDDHTERLNALLKK